MLKASLDAYMASLCETDEVYTPRFHSSKRKNVQISSIYL